MRKDNKNKLFLVIGLLLPMVGFAIYFFQKNSKKNKIILKSSILGIFLYCFIGFPLLLNLNNKIEIKNNVNEWLSETSENKTIVTVLGKSTCEHCMAYKPVIDKIAKKEKFTLYFFELDSLSDNEYDSIMNSKFLDTYEGYVPYTIIISNGEKVKDLTGYSTEEQIRSFLSENGVY